MISPTNYSILIVTDQSSLDRFLNIKYILNNWGSIQDGPLTVGECFENPSDGANITNSIVKVARFPPTTSELENPQRFASIVRESTARPQKRHYEHLIQSPTRCASPLISCEVADNPDWGSGHLIDSHGAANKRRKLQDNRVHGYNPLSRSMLSCGGFKDEGYDYSQSAVRHLSPSVQVIDSQRSLERKRK